MDETHIGAVILALRKQQGMTQEQLAEAVGVSPPAVSKWETGDSRVDQGLTPLAPHRNRTCAINAYGSSFNIHTSSIKQTHIYPWFYDRECR